MQANELKAVLEVTKEIAVYPAHIEVRLPHHFTTRSPKWGRRNYCPTGCKRATVIENGHNWIEKRPVTACGDRDFEIQRRNGVLVEFDRDDFPDWNEKKIHISGNRVLITNGFKTIQHMTPYPHTTAEHRDGKTYIRMVVSRSAIVATWGEYSLIEAKREQEQQNSERKQAELRDPQAQLFGMTREEFTRQYVDRSGERSIYLGAEWTEKYKFDSNGNYVTDESGSPVVLAEVGRIQITLDQANKILNLLTPKQKKALSK